MWARERGVSVRELQESTDADEFAEWLAYQELNPASEERADFRAAIVAAVVANLFKGKKDKMISPIDFMPYTERPKVSAKDQALQVEQKILAWSKMIQAKQAKRKAIRGQA